MLSAKERNASGAEHTDKKQQGSLQLKLPNFKMRKRRPKKTKSVSHKANEQ